MTGMYIGSDNYSPSLTYFYKNPALNGQLEVERQGKAYCWWMAYTRSMENEYYGDSFRTMAIQPDWRYADADVLKDYTDLGGTGIPEFR